MELLFVLGIPAFLLAVLTLLVSNGSKELREKLFHLEMSGRPAQIWTFGVLFMSTVSIIMYFFKK